MNTKETIMSILHNDDGTKTMRFDINLEPLQTVIDSHIYHELPKLIADKLADELFPAFRDKAVKDEKFMLEVLNTIRSRTAQKLLENDK